MSDDGLYKRGNIWYAAPWRVSTGCRDRVAARAWRAEYERRINDPTYRASHEATLGAAIDGFINDRSAPGKRALAKATVGYYETKAESIYQIIKADTPLAQVTRAAVKALIKQRLDEGASQHTVWKEIGLLKSALRWARAEGLLAVDPATILPVGMSTGYEPRRGYVTPEGAWLVIRALETPRPNDRRQPENAQGRAAHVAFIFGSGARMAEAQRAERADVRLADGLVRVRGSKTKGSDKDVPVISTTKPFLEYALRHAPGGASGRLFRPWAKMWRDVGAACRRAGLPRRTANDFRRSLGSWLYQGGVPLEQIADVLRHASVEMARRVYAVPDAAATGALIEHHLSAKKRPGADTVRPDEPA